MKIKIQLIWEKSFYSSIKVHLLNSQQENKILTYGQEDGEKMMREARRHGTKHGRLRQYHGHGAFTRGKIKGD